MTLLVEALRYKPEGRVFDSRGVFRIFPSGRTMALGVDSASNRKDYQEYFLVVKAIGAYG